MGNDQLFVGSLIPLVHCPQGGATPEGGRKVGDASLGQSFGTTSVVLGGWGPKIYSKKHGEIGRIVKFPGLSRPAPEMAARWAKLNS